MTLTVETVHGPARVHIRRSDEPSAALVLGHGAGGGVNAPDLSVAADAAAALNLAVALVEQPYRVAGRRSPPPATHLDTAWIAVVEHLRAGELRGVPLITGGRSSGARVACRTAGATGAIGVLCLAFPLLPPARANGTRGPSRLPELDEVTVPVLVVQGTGDRFGMPPPSAQRTVAQVAGNHSLHSDRSAISVAVGAWLHAVVAEEGRKSSR